MARGTAAKIGDERISANGYRYRKTEAGWETVHRLIAEEKMGRRLEPDEYAAFIDGDRTNLDPKNIEVRKRGRASVRRRLAQVEARLAEYTALKEELECRIQLRNNL